MRAIVDVEANELLDKATQIWCIIVNPLPDDTNTAIRHYDIFVPDNYVAEGNMDALPRKLLNPTDKETVSIKPLSTFKEYSKQIAEWIGHNLINYDSRVLEKLGYVDHIEVKNMTDTMILSQLTGPNRQGGHSLKSWGMRFEDHKGEWTDFSVFDWAMVDYCLQDIRVTHRLYNYMMGNTKSFSKFSIRLEHAVRRILDQMQDNGFYLDEERAHTLYTEIKAKCEAIEQRFEVDFPPEKVYYKKLYPRVSKSTAEMHGQDKRTLDASQWDKEVDELGETYYHLFRMVGFNPRSTSQIVDRMNKLGWNPVVFNDPTEAMLKKGIEQGSPQVCEENFETLPEDAPESAKNLAKYFLYDKRLQKLDEWFREQNPKTGCIHGRVFGCGAHTMRMTHRNPNMANISKVMMKKDENGKEKLVYGEDGKYATDMRACFTTRDKTKRRLVGVDLSGIQLRAFAHYAYDKNYTEQILSGDIHSYNCGIITRLIEEYCKISKLSGDSVEFLKRDPKGRRDMSKTFIYAYLFGAGNKKVGSIFEFPEKHHNKAGKFIKEGFVTSISGLDEFKKNIAKWAKQGCMVALDGRLISLPSEHIGLSVALQSFEAIIMKYALVISMRKIKERGLDALLVGIIHDESQWDCAEKDAEAVGKLVVESMEEAGVYFKSNIPITGTYNIGLTWADSH